MIMFILTENQPSINQRVYEELFKHVAKNSESKNEHLDLISCLFIFPYFILQTQLLNEEQDDEFDIIESEPDSYHSDESDNECNSLNKSPDKESITEAKRIEKRLQEINKVKIGLREFIQVLDKPMLTLFTKTILFYLILGFTLCGIYLVFVYFFNEAAWYEYFPVEEDDEVLPEMKQEL